VIRILLADDQALIRSGIRSLLDAEDDIEVVAEAADGRSNAAIATELSMTEATIKSYVSRLLTKLDCTNRVQAAIVAIDAGLTEEP